MCNRWLGYMLMIALGLAIGFTPGQVRAEPWDVSGNSLPTLPVPIGPYQHDGSGFYTGIEFLMMHETRAIGRQVIASRGYVPSFDFPNPGGSPSPGFVGGVPRGSGATALASDQLGNTSWAPGWRITAGYRMEDGTSFSVSWAHLQDVKYSGGAGSQGPNFAQVDGGDNTFLFAPVFNFSPLFSGAPNRVIATVPGVGTAPVSGLLNGIWNGASDMSMLFSQRFDNWDIAGRFPVFQSENARSYAIAGARFAWIWERFQWVTTDLNYTGDDTTGFTASYDGQYAARYDNTLSQRMYGPMIGAGHEVYLGSGFGLGCETSFAPLLDIAKERVKYIRVDETTQAKRGWIDNTITLNLNFAINLTWQPFEGMTLRAGWNAYNFFNTYYMERPVGFNMGALDPTYGTQIYRLMHGLNVGLAYTW
ncbi:Lpg1974 family pore-forming outer membrane protein [Zavarzinella formosa]|uniref:Lpg1974 family pore-forming outer membrane protein n=1 Tax=Zavarzinella formosa TaxID=360055 RepID=UPI0012F96CA3|nr:Lpg1974 family pore-forming outer membrane protein [Zavarzinella formosa]